MPDSGSSVSVVMPVFNGAAYLQTALDSMIGQTWPAWELIVIDDGSTDETAEVVRRIKDSRVRYVYQANRGQASALNHGLSLCSGEYVTTLDADDWYPPDSVADRARYLDRHPEVDVVYGDGVYVSEQGEVLGLFTAQMPAGVQGDVFDRLLTSPFYGTGATVMVRRSILEAQEIRYDESLVWCQDWDFYLRLAARFAFGFTDTVAINYRVHQSGMTVTMPAGRRLESLIRMRMKALDLSRFNRVAPADKQAFFYDLLVRNLHGDEERQRAVLSTDAFRQLPGEQQANLVRQTAIAYLLAGERPELVKHWLARAWAASPLNLKTLATLVLTSVHAGVARRVATAWQYRRRDEGPPNPFDRASVTRS